MSLLHLPPEIRTQIYGYLDPYSLFNTSQVCQLTRNDFNEEFWIKLIQSQFPEENLYIPESFNWKKKYFSLAAPLLHTQPGACRDIRTKSRGPFLKSFHGKEVLYAEVIGESILIKLLDVNTRKITFEHTLGKWFDKITSLAFNGDSIAFATKREWCPGVIHIFDKKNKGKVLEQWHEPQPGNHSCDWTHSFDSLYFDNDELFANCSDGSIWRFQQNRLLHVNRLWESSTYVFPKKEIVFSSHSQPSSISHRIKINYLHYQKCFKCNDDSKINKYLLSFWQGSENYYSPYNTFCIFEMELQTEKLHSCKLNGTTAFAATEEGELHIVLNKNKTIIKKIADTPLTALFVDDKWVAVASQRRIDIFSKTDLEKTVSIPIGICQVDDIHIEGRQVIFTTQEGVVSSRDLFRKSVPQPSSLLDKIGTMIKALFK